MANQELVKDALVRLGLGPSCAKSAGTRSKASAIVSWQSPRFGVRTGRAILSNGDSWLLVMIERTGSLTWVREDLCHD